eukprot:1150976-Amphidinium_carterae.1
MARVDTTVKEQRRVQTLTLSEISPVVLFVFALRFSSKFELRIKLKKFALKKFLPFFVPQQGLATKWENTDEVLDVILHPMRYGGGFLCPESKVTVES